MSGRLIVFEGIDGAGKSTHARKLQDHLKDAVLFREPGGTKLGEDVRGILLSHRDDDMYSESEFLLYMAARDQLLSEKMRPALKSGATVILDRYYYSTAAYQGAGRGFGVQRVLDICDKLQFETPDRVFLLDLTPEEALKRLAEGKDRIESRGVEYFRTVREAFLKMTKDTRFCTIDASGSLEDVQAEIRRLVSADHS